MSRRNNGLISTKSVPRPSSQTCCLHARGTILWLRIARGQSMKCYVVPRFFPKSSIVSGQILVQIAISTVQIAAATHRRRSRSTIIARLLHRLLAQSPGPDTPPCMSPLIDPISSSRSPRVLCRLASAGINVTETNNMASDMTSSEAAMGPELN